MFRVFVGSLRRLSARSEDAASTPRPRLLLIGSQPERCDAAVDGALTHRTLARHLHKLNSLDPDTLARLTALFAQSRTAASSPNSVKGAGDARRALDKVVQGYPGASGLASTLGRELATDGRELLLNLMRLNYLLYDVVGGVVSALAQVL